MDLPTCPSCGQSVLDDDPVTCPFCGAAMDGSSGPTKARAKSAPRKKKKGTSGESARPKAKQAVKAEPSEAASDDPFDIAASPQARRAIACSPRRTKSRPVRVTCPMCDERGYVPTSAIGKQVKCCNPDCMVPLFTAPDPETRKTKTASVPTRVSDQAAEQEASLSTPARQRSPMAIYGILGAVLLLAGLGLKYYLDSSPGQNQLGKPIPVNPLPVQDDGESDGSNAAGIDTEETNGVRVIAASLVDQMIQSAQLSVNRDKALCRRLTAEAFLRLGMTDRVDGELAQLIRVSHQHRRVDDYYRIGPLAQRYWIAVRRGDQATADDVFGQMKIDSKTIPATGLLAIDASVTWGAVLMHQGQTEEAHDVVERMHIDNSVRSRTDQLDRGVWSTVTIAMARHGQRSDSPISRLVWADPLAAAVAIELSLQQRWETAISWADSWSDDVVQCDILAEVARQAMRVQASSETLAAIVEASKQSDIARTRIQAILAQASVPRLQSAQDVLLAESLSTSSMPSIGQLLRYRAPDLIPMNHAARTLAALARSAAQQGQTDVAALAISQMCDATMQNLPPTSAVRSASRELDLSPGDVEMRIRTYQGLSAGANVSSDFRRYRRGLDRLAGAVEMRRLLMICLLCDVVAADGGAGLNEALKQSELLTDELTLDPLCQFIAAEALLAGGSVPVLAAADTARVPRGSRTAEQLENSLASVWLKTVSSASGTYDASLLSSLDAVSELPGLRSSLQCRLAEALANRPETNVALMDALVTIRNEVTREVSMWTASLWMTRAGKADDVETWTQERRLSATDRVLTISGIVSGLEIPVDDPEEETL